MKEAEYDKTSVMIIIVIICSIIATIVVSAVFADMFSLTVAVAGIIVFGIFLGTAESFILNALAEVRKLNR